MKEVFTLLALLSACAIEMPVNADFVHDNYPAAVLEDVGLDTAELIWKYKYPIETHFVTTDDKYILRLHRIPKEGGRPVLLMHGLLDSSITWVLMGPWSGLGYYLHDNGYDVWMGNARGNRYSRNHTSLDPNNDKSFWKFSWHEIGYYDLPAMIDYVLQKTESKKLTYFGHSQGTTSFFVMSSMRPEYNEKINSMQALAPVVFMKHIKTKLISLMRNMLIVGNQFTELTPHSDLFYKNCFRSQLLLDLCVDNIWQIMGKDTADINATMWPLILYNIPAGAGIKQLLHYDQLMYTDRFGAYDHGVAENVKQYGTITPPEYPLQNVRVPVGLYYTSNDYLTSEVDVQRLARLLPNVVQDTLYPYKKWNHLTVIWGINARELAHKRILEVIKKFE